MKSEIACKYCAWDDIQCASCYSRGGLSGWISFSHEELKDLLSNLQKCQSEGYLNYDDAAYWAMEKIELELSYLDKIPTLGEK